MLRLACLLARYFGYSRYCQATWNAGGFSRGPESVFMFCSLCECVCVFLQSPPKPNEKKNEATSVGTLRKHETSQMRGRCEWKYNGALSRAGRDRSVIGRRCLVHCASADKNSVPGIAEEARLGSQPVVIKTPSGRFVPALPTQSIRQLPLHAHSSITSDWSTTLFDRYARFSPTVVNDHTISLGKHAQVSCLWLRAVGFYRVSVKFVIESIVPLENHRNENNLFLIPWNANGGENLSEIAEDPTCRLFVYVVFVFLPSFYDYFWLTWTWLAYLLWNCIVEKLWRPFHGFQCFILPILVSTSLLSCVLCAYFNVTVFEFPALSTVHDVQRVGRYLQSIV